MENPYQAPETLVEDTDINVEYAGFWVRVLASILDGLLLLLITVPVQYAFIGDALWDPNSSGMSGVEIVMGYIFPFAYTLTFWCTMAATPAKRLLGLKIIDVNTGEPIRMSQGILRYIGYFCAYLPFFIGIMWVGWDARKQGWHDKMAQTAVIRQ